MMLSYTLFTLSLLCTLGFSCRLDSSVNIYRCELPLEITAEGSADWERVQIFKHPRKRFNLKKNTYERTPNVVEVIINSAESLEPGLFDGLQKMDQLVIDNSDMQELPLGILDNSPVRILQLFNSTRSIPLGSFSKTAALRNAEIRNNYYLGDIKKGLFNGTPIYKLFLDRNGIENIEDGAFFNMDNMLFLSLTGNKLKTFNSKAVLGDNIVRALWLGKNQITTISTDMFSGCTELQELSLEFNGIHTIEDTPFKHLSALWYLDLSNNDIQELNPKMYSKEGTKTLRTLFIHNNKLTYIYQTLFIRVPSLEGISYGGNPLQCPCMDEVRHWTGEHNITRLCDNDYSSGERPTCVYSDLSRSSCIYDADLTADLLEIYNVALQEYPKLPKKCDTTNGYANATLVNHDY